MRPVRWIALTAVFLAGTAGLAVAQVAPDSMASQSLRPYAHVFVAYAIAWLLIGGWMVSIHRRLGRLERSRE